MKMKRTLFAATVAFALASSSAAGQGVKMTDQQLDQVTAAGAMSLVIISNPGNAKIGRNLDFSAGGHAMCINCAEAFPAANESKTFGAVLVANRKFDPANYPTMPIMRCIGGGMTGFC